MFLGDFAFALPAKKAAPKLSLGTLVFAAHFAGIVRPNYIGKPCSTPIRVVA